MALSEQRMQELSVTLLQIASGLRKRRTFDPAGLDLYRRPPGIVPLLEGGASEERVAVGPGIEAVQDRKTLEALRIEFAGERLLPWTGLRQRTT